MKTFLIARASSPTQKLTAQIAELKAAYPNGEVISGYRSGVSAKNKEALTGYLDMCEPSDKLVFLRLSRVCRSLEQFLWFFKAADKKKVNIVLLKDDIDFSTATGRMCGSMLCCIIQWQREIQLENCREGRKAKESLATFEGWGRKSSLSKARVSRIIKAREEGKTLKNIAEDENLSVSYIHRLTSPEKAKRYNQYHLKRQREKTAAPNLS
jgi:DNA invertase Pin-like site-specific DNA recombinase